MEEIKIKLNIRPLTFPNQVKTRQVKDSFPGPMCATCKCGNHFASFKMEPPTEFEAFRNAIQVATRQFMVKNGIIRPLAGLLMIDVTVGFQRPLKHYDKADNSLLDEYRYRAPMVLPAYYRILESVTKSLYGVAFTDMKQISDCGFHRVYRESHCIEIVIKEVNPSDIDGNIKQMELF